MYGLKTDSNRINFGLGIDKKYTTDNYNTIIMNEIGKDAIES